MVHNAHKKNTFHVSPFFTTTDQLIVAQINANKALIHFLLQPAITQKQQNTLPPLKKANTEHFHFFKVENLTLRGTDVSTVDLFLSHQGTQDHLEPRLKPPII